MESIYFLIPLALILLGLGIAAFIWATRSGQFDDLDREAHRILFDEDSTPKPNTSIQTTVTQTADKQTADIQSPHSASPAIEDNANGEHLD